MSCSLDSLRYLEDVTQSWLVDQGGNLAEPIENSASEPVVRSNTSHKTDALAGIHGTASGRRGEQE
jgi:hypothetical protein